MAAKILQCKWSLIDQSEYGQWKLIQELMNFTGLQKSHSTDYASSCIKLHTCQRGVQESGSDFPENFTI